MIRCIVLDGWHKGHMVDLPEPRQVISLIRPRVITFDDCCDGSEVADVSSNKHDYSLAFRSVDGEVALYSTDGKSKHIYNQRDWITTADGKWAEQPLYVGIHDPRAIMEYDITPPKQEVNKEVIYDERPSHERDNQL